MPGPVLRFVYAVDGDLFSTVKDYVHKLVSPGTYPCSLCSLTYGPLGPDRGWTCFVKQLPVEAKFLHRDEFRTSHRLPVVLLDQEVLVRSDEIDACTTTQALIDLVQVRLDEALATKRAS